MNSRDRVLTALEHREPDRIAIDFGGMRSTGIVAPAYRRLKEHLGLDATPPKIYDVFQWLAEPEPEVLDIVGGDVVQLHRYRPAFGIAIKEWKTWRGPDGLEYSVPADFNPIQAEDGRLEIRDPGNPERVIAVMPKGGFWFDQVYFPLAEAKTYEDIDNFAWEVIEDDEVEWLSAQARRLHQETDRAILAAFGGNLLEGGHFDFGYQRFMEMLASNRDLVEYYLDKKANAWVEMLKKYLPAVKDYVHIIQVGDDLGMQTGPQISPRMYRELFKPYHQRIYSYIRENSNLYLFLHSCGGFYEIIPDLIEIGVQILNPVQVSAAGMDPIRLKKEFGKNLTFWGGGLNTQHTLIHGSLEDIRREVREMIDIFAPGGGFVFTQIHNIQHEVSPDRVMAIYDTAQEHGRYPIIS